ncbi:hypothetical protein AVEN_166102-1 [Araneus ventricosus]|uniref:Uncharacterized protein n=1 Tax=Araneus ventricosus TaxID=182803 RepID=A0A4Y2FPF7_ARAVE|nr:hypothetical protein AVEN_166102-1 [Araneus ventricosus]
MIKILKQVGYSLEILTFPACTFLADDREFFTLTLKFLSEERRRKAKMIRQRLHQIEQSPVEKQGLWINDVVSILVHVHPSNTIGNETRQTRQRVSSHQQSNGGGVGPRKGVKLCAAQSATVHEWAFGSESPY